MCPWSCQVYWDSPPDPNDRAYHPSNNDIIYMWQSMTNPAYGIFYENRDCNASSSNDLWTYCRSILRAIARLVFLLRRFFSDHSGIFNFEKLRPKRVAMHVNNVSVYYLYTHAHCATSALCNDQLITRSTRWETTDIDKETILDKETKHKVSGKLKEHKK